MSTPAFSEGWHLVELIGKIRDEVKKVYPGLTSPEALEVVTVIADLLENRPDGVSLAEAFADRVQQEMRPGERNWASSVHLATFNRRPQ